MDMVKALIEQGYSEQSAYAIAISRYEKKHGHKPAMHHNTIKNTELLKEEF